MGSLNWASGLIPLGRLYLKPLQRHFHSLGLTDRFMPPCRSDPLVLANLLRQWQDPRFLTSGIPIRTFQADFTIFTDASTQGWGAHMGDSKISVTWTRTDCKLHINCLELKAVIFALQHWAPRLQGHQVMIATDNSTVVSYINKQGGTVDLFLWLEAQNIIVRARHIPGCLNVIADHLSRPNQPISTEWSLHPEIVERIFRVWGTPEVDMFATLSNSHLPRFMSPILEPRALAVDALSQDWQGLAGEVNVHVSPIPPAQQSHSEASIHSGGRGSSCSLLVANSIVFSTSTTSLCGTPPSSSLPSGSSVPARSEVRLGWKVVPSARMEALMRHYKAAGFQKRSLGSRQPLGGPQPIACTTIDGFASLDWAQDKGLIHLIPQLLVYSL